jgi:hypothetical protein
MSSSRRVGKGAPAPCPPFYRPSRFAMVGTLRFAHPTISRFVFAVITREGG